MASATEQPDTKPSAKWFWKALAASFLFSVCVAAVGYLPGDLTRCNWPTTSGTVVRSDSSFFVNDPSTGKGWLRANLEYSYNVGGRDYHGTHYDHDGPYGNFVPFNEERVADLLSLYPVGRQVTVYYKPEDPSVAVLMPHMAWWLWGLLLVANTLLGMIILANWRHFKRWRAKRKAAA
jgi:hypothetical protein